ncbi:uncharacterized protein G2W53_019946 [Senna tora]|uniref:Uncharacterized protein n=1 Tax=Senna tora TaxID=362788 RepID=A0A834TV72_9FABA|nr:uncharacterized protein G2W53_019946 [Senna tora]
MKECTACATPGLALSYPPILPPNPFINLQFPLNLKAMEILRFSASDAVVR